MIERGTRLGPYEIETPLGAGGMGEVYKGRDTRLKRSVAIKILPAHLSTNPELKLRFEREARAISALNHPNICVLHDVGEAKLAITNPTADQIAAGATSNTSYLVMELCEGETLANRLVKGPLPIDQVLRYGIEIADALDRAHRSGITHRDLKPGNIMLTKGGAKLLDFGLAKAKSSGIFEPDGSTALKPVTEEGMIVGTIQYMAPEQIEGREADHRSDIFAFGAMLYEMVTGKRAFGGSSRASLIAAILEREPQPIAEIAPLSPPALDRVIRSCLAKDPDDRWQSAHDLRRELQWMRDGLSSPVQTAPAIARSGRSRERIAWAAAVLLPLLVAAFMWVALRPSEAPPVRLVSAIAPPAGAEIVVSGDAGGPVTLSPDGRLAAFVATSDAGPMLYVQSLQTGITRVLKGTERAMFPFWSSDSRSLGFFASGKLAIADLDGAPPRTLADAADGRGGAWGRDGTIVYTPHTQAGIMRIAASGGTPTAVTKLEAPYMTHRWPSLHPDGKHVLYLAAMHSIPESEETAIFMAALDGSGTHKLVASPGNGLVWKDWLLYLKANKLVAQRLNGSTLEGEPTVVWEDVLYDGGTWRTVFSVSNEGLFSTHGRANADGNTVVSWLDRQGNKIGEIGPPAFYRDVALSPDESMIAMSIGDPLSTIYLHDVARGSRTRFSFVEGATFAPNWTPDGRNIIFTALRDAKFQLLIKPADGTAPERVLYESDTLLRPSAVTPDSRYLLFDRDSGLAGDIMRIPLEGGEPEMVVGGPLQPYEGKLSADGKWLAYIDSNVSGRHLFVTPYPPSGARWQVSNEPVYLSFWNRNGKELLYVTAYGIRSVGLELDERAVRVGQVTSLFSADVNTNDRGIAMSADGSRFLVVPIRQSTSGAATLITNFDLPLRK